MNEPPMSLDEAREFLCKLANAFMYQKREPRWVGVMNPYFYRLLEEVEKCTRGDILRCYCLEGQRALSHKHDVHDIRHDICCPAYIKKE